jgi:osmotically-inducible protein OsmY
VRIQRYSRRAALLNLPVLALLVRRAQAGEETISDDLLYDRVNRELITDRDLGTRQLQVKVESGVVTVAGFVASEKMQKKVEKVVKKVKGVQKVVNETKIRAGL